MAKKQAIVQAREGEPALRGYGTAGGDSKVPLLENVRISKPRRALVTIYFTPFGVREYLRLSIIMAPLRGWPSAASVLLMVDRS